MCKALHTIIIESSELELLLRLGEHGLRLRAFPANDNLSRSDKRVTAAVEKLNQFNDWESAWTRMKYSRKSETIPVKTNYHLTEGILGLGIKTPSAPLQDDKLRGIGFYKLWASDKACSPGSEKEIQESEMWISHENVGLAIMDFSYDPTQDLMILVELSPDERFVCSLADFYCDWPANYSFFLLP